jgi:hypothetical protein
MELVTEGSRKRINRAVTAVRDRASMRGRGLLSRPGPT